MDGGWSLTYDNVNRVSTATATSGVWNNLTLSWMYDSFGNRKNQTPSGRNILAPVPQAQSLNYYPGENRISNYGTNGYDGAGNVENDLINQYLYDPEGRLCAVAYSTGTTTGYMLYLYDGEGRRVAKVSNPTFSCTPSTGSTLLETYLLGPSGEHITELGQAGAFLRSNVYANGQLLATYTNNATYFAFNNWLGSKRVVTNYDGTVAQMCMNLPFGDELMCSAPDVSEQHFTGQIHDQESGNDYFNARYYSNNTGRFLSPDPSGLSYADPTNPQSLNLYSYVLNNPLRNIDPSGEECVWDDGSFDAADDPDTGNAAGCSGQGGTYVDPSLFEGVEGNRPGSWSGQANSSIAFDWLTPSATVNGNTPWTFTDFQTMYQAWNTGILPQQLNYGPWTVESIDMSHNWALNQARAAYIKAGCPSSFGFSTGSGFQGHAAAAVDSWGNVVLGQPDWLELQVGGFSGTVAGSDGDAEFTVNNPMTNSSFNGQSAFTGGHSSDNPNGPNGPRHNVMQTFKWSEQGLCQ